MIDIGESYQKCSMKHFHLQTINFKVFGEFNLKILTKLSGLLWLLLFSNYVTIILLSRC